MTERPPVARLLLVRHRQSTWNAERRWAGQADPPLSLHGEAEARALVPVLAPLGFDAIVTSDLARARRTGELIGAAMPWSPIGQDARLREIDIPGWAGRTKADLQTTSSAEYVRWRSAVPGPPPGAETWEGFERRVLAALHGCADRAGTVLVIAHSGVLKAALTALRQPRKVGRSKGVWVERRHGHLTLGPVVRLTNRTKKSARSDRPGHRRADAD